MFYKTVEKTTESEIVIERSRFITQVTPCGTAEEAKDILAERRKKHFQATHNCYAYISDGGKYSKFSDDGEPSGTAGAPIMNALTNSGLINVMVIVTRYFGGIKLGAGGLTRAYARCAQEGIKSAEQCVYTLAKKISITLQYEDYQAFLRLKENGFKVSDTQFSDKVTVTLFVKSEAIGAFSEVFTEKFNGKYGYLILGEEYFKFD